MVDTSPYGRRLFPTSLSALTGSDALSFNAALETSGVLISEKITLEFEVSAVGSA